MRLGLLASVVLWILILTLTGCSFHVGMDWNGETAVDKRTFTNKKDK